MDELTEIQRARRLLEDAGFEVKPPTLCWPLRETPALEAKMEAQLEADPEAPICVTADEFFGLQGRLMWRHRLRSESELGPMTFAGRPIVVVA